MKAIKLFVLFLLLICVIYSWYKYYKWAISLNVITIESFNPGPSILMIGGTHGNEPASKVALLKFSELMKKNALKRGKLVIIPETNKSGGHLSLRFMSHNWINPDLNRNYSDRGKDDISRKIIKYVNESDFILDFHEGWGFRKINKESIGSTLSYTTEFSKELSKKLINKLNDKIKDENKKFLLNNENDELLTLRNFSSRKGKNYILVETTGQSNIQPLDLRVEQNMLIIENFLLDLNMI